MAIPIPVKAKKGAHLRLAVKIIIKDTPRIMTPVLRFVAMTMAAAGITHKNIRMIPFHFFIRGSAALHIAAKKMININFVNSEGWNPTGPI